jgi:hypothetical protein
VGKGWLLIQGQGIVGVVEESGAILAGVQGKAIFLGDLLGLCVILGAQLADGGLLGAGGGRLGGLAEIPQVEAIGVELILVIREHRIAQV